MHFQWFLCALDESEQERHTQTHGNEEKWGIFSIFPVNQFYKVRFCSVPMLLCIPIYACACGSAVVVRFCWWFFFSIQFLEFSTWNFSMTLFIYLFRLPFFNSIHFTKQNWKYWFFIFMVAKRIKWFFYLFIINYKNWKCIEISAKYANLMLIIFEQCVYLVHQECK